VAAIDADSSMVVVYGLRPLHGGLGDCLSEQTVVGPQRGAKKVHAVDGGALAIQNMDVSPPSPPALLNTEIGPVVLVVRKASWRSGPDVDRRRSRRASFIPALDQ
jgi:hypothetical protein